jgi:hypothetical protein
LVSVEVADDVFVVGEDAGGWAIWPIWANVGTFDADCSEVFVRLVTTRTGRSSSFWVVVLLEGVGRETEPELVVWWELLKVSDELTDREVGTVFGHGLMVLLGCKNCTEELELQVLRGG